MQTSACKGLHAPLQYQSFFQEGAHTLVLSPLHEQAYSLIHHRLVTAHRAAQQELLVLVIGVPQSWKLLRGVSFSGVCDGCDEQARGAKAKEGGGRGEGRGEGRGGESAGRGGTSHWSPGYGMMGRWRSPMHQVLCAVKG